MHAYTHMQIIHAREALAKEMYMSIYTCPYIFMHVYGFRADNTRTRDARQRNERVHIPSRD